MSKYIDAEKLKAEIERRRLSNRYIDTEGYENELLEIIDSLQQEQQVGEEYAIEVGKHTHTLCVGSQSDIDNLIRQEKQGQLKDLEKEVSKWWDAFFQEPDFKFRKHRAHIVTNDEIIKLARHFYELGLNARKEK